MAINFYKGKEINQILSMDSRYPIYMDFCDTRFISEEFEYLKRVYYYKTTSGKPELPQRMKMICCTILLTKNITPPAPPYQPLPTSIR